MGTCRGIHVLAPTIHPHNTLPRHIRRTHDMRPRQLPTIGTHDICPRCGCDVYLVDVCRGRVSWGPIVDTCRGGVSWAHVFPTIHRGGMSWAHFVFMCPTIPYLLSTTYMSVPTRHVPTIYPHDMYPRYVPTIPITGTNVVHDMYPRYQDVVHDMYPRYSPRLVSWVHIVGNTD